jgi:hypothetical protein
VYNTNPVEHKYLIKLDKHQTKFELKKLGKFFITNNSNVRIYYVLRTSNKAFTTFIKNILFDQTTSNKIRINSLLQNASPKIIAQVFGSLINCEGSIRYTELTRSIYVRMCNKKYLTDWKELLKKIHIKSRVSNCKSLFQLTITCNQNFTKLINLGFYLHHNKKRTRFENIIAGYKKLQVERNTALEYYFNIVKSNPNKSAIELSKITKKNKRTISHYLKKLCSLGQINWAKIDKKKYIYF